MPPRPRLKLAIVGGGPSAFFAASRLLQLLPLAQTQLQSTPEVAVHIYDGLWAPYGLVRFGVAPDHPEVKVRFSSFFYPLVELYICELHRTARTNLMNLREIQDSDFLGM